MFPCDGPYEAQEFPGYGRTDLALGHAARRKAPVASAEPSLRFPGDILHGGRGAFRAALQVPGLARREAVAPGRFHQDPPHVGVARFGDRAPLSSLSAGVLAGHQSDKGHELTRRVEAGDVAQFGQHRDRGERVHPAKRHQVLSLAGKGPVTEHLFQFLFQGLDPCLGVLYLVHVFLEDDLLRRMSEALGLEPAVVRLGPSAAPGVYAAVTQKKAGKPLPHAPLGVLEVLARPFQVADRLLFFIGHPHRGQFPVPVQSGQGQSVATVRLDPVARTTRDQRRRHHRAFVSQGAQLTIDPVAAGTRLVAEPQRCPRPGELVRQFCHRGPRGLDRAIEHRRPAVLGNRHRDRIFMYVHRHESCRFTHSLLLLDGDRSLGGLPHSKDNPRIPRTEEVFL